MQLLYHKINPFEIDDSMFFEFCWDRMENQEKWSGVKKSSSFQSLFENSLDEGQEF